MEQHPVRPAVPRPLLLALVCVWASVSLACGSLGATSEPAITSTPPEARVMSVRFATQVSQEFEPVTVSSRFERQTREVWAVVELSEVGEPLTLRGEWAYLGPEGTSNPTVLTNASVRLEPSPDGLLRSGLQLTKDDFEPGVYELRVTLDGHEAAVGRFEVR